MHNKRLPKQVHHSDLYWSVRKGHLFGWPFQPVKLLLLTLEEQKLWCILKELTAIL